MIADLRPGILDQLGLVPALRWVADHTLVPNGINVTVEEEGLDRRLPREIETILFRIGQEAMNNVARHARARNVRIELLLEQSVVKLTVADDGSGFDSEEALGRRRLGSGVGLAGMQERVSMIGGTLDIISEPGGGTELRITVPLPEGMG